MIYIIVSQFLLFHLQCCVKNLFPADVLLSLQTLSFVETIPSNTNLSATWEHLKQKARPCQQLY